MAQPVLLRLSPAEWMLSVMTVQPDAASSLAEAVNKTMTPERLQGALQAARDALLARDLGRLNAEGRLEINPVVRSCARAVISPRASFGLTLIEADGTSRVVFYNWLPGFAVGTWVDANQIRTFELLDTDDKITEGILTKWSGLALGSGPSIAPILRQFNVPAANLPALPVTKPEKVEGLVAAFVRGGLPQEEAVQLEHAFATPNKRAVLAAAHHANLESHTLMWLASEGKAWSISQASGANDIKITSTNLAGLTQVVAAFTRDLLASAR